MDYDKMEYRQYTSKSEFDRQIHILEGILKGISIDNEINRTELEEIDNWCKTNFQYANRQPFKDLLPLIDEALKDNTLDDEEIADILYYCQNFKADSKYYDVITSEMQVLQGIMHGILADNQISNDEAEKLFLWMDSKEHLRGVYPFDELYSILLSFTKDGIIDSHEEEVLKVFFSDFIKENRVTTIDFNQIHELSKSVTIDHVCSVDPEIEFDGKVFCLTGKSSRATRKEFVKVIEDKGGSFSKGVNKKVDYLIVGDEGNACWAFACYGRKVEQAVELRKQHSKPVIVHENDFWDV